MKIKEGDVVEVLNLVSGDSEYGIQVGKTYKVDTVCTSNVDIILPHHAIRRSRTRSMYHDQVKIVNEIKIEETEKFTIYNVGNIDKYRIVEYSDNRFIIQKLYKRQKTKGYLWWKENYGYNEWERVDQNGEKYYSLFHLSSLNSEFKVYKTLNKAIKWIENINKYPIYH